MFGHLMKKQWTTKQFSKVLCTLYNTKVQYKNGKNNRISIYCDVAMREFVENKTTQATCNSELFAECSSGDTIISSSTYDNVDVLIKTNIIVNGQLIYKTVQFRSDFTWSLSVCGKLAPLQKLGFSDVYQPNVESVKHLLSAVRAVKLCHGRDRPPRVQVHGQTTEVLSFASNENSLINKLRSRQCCRFLSFTTSTQICRSCQQMNLTLKQVPEVQSHVPPEVHSDASRDISGNLTKIFPHASPEFVELLLLQHNIQETAKPTGYRWTSEIISLCLTIFTRSPQAYNDLRNSGMLILPTPNHLSLYKNAVNTDSGINPALIQWMYKSAIDNKLPSHGWHGGLVIDEMKIQEDLQMVRSSKDLKMVGFVDMGQEANLLQQLKSGTSDKQLADHVFQIQFIGATGFRFFCGYLPTRSTASATDIHINLWNAVELIESHGFVIDYVGMDGGETNRQFISLNFPRETARAMRFVAKSPLDRSRKMILIMDFSHVVKKIRNNMFSSGPHGTRYLMLPTGKAIEWQHWVKAYSWDQKSPIQIHRKLSKEHIDLNSKTKMRNHLAEQVLDKDMLQLMLEFQKSEGANGCHLDGTIQLISATSEIISFFRDTRPLLSPDDVRMDKIQAALTWFLEWEQTILSDSDLTAPQRNRKLMSDKTRDDLASCVHGFQELCLMWLKKFPDNSLYQHRINSDVLENSFCQQRGLHNGANTNPNLLTYSKTNNSITLGQATISKKSNTSGRSTGAKAFKFTSPGPLRPKTASKRKLHVGVPPNPKTIRM